MVPPLGINMPLLTHSTIHFEMALEVTPNKDANSLFFNIVILFSKQYLINVKSFFHNPFNTLLVSLFDASLA